MEPNNVSPTYNNTAGVVPLQRELRCPYCVDYFEDPSQHFIAKHQLRIKDINSILDIQKYLNFWKDKAPTIHDLHKYSHKNGDLFELANQDNDEEIRKQVRLAIIHDLVEEQQREREDPSFERQCLFCTTNFKGTRRELFQHMYQTHHFNIGSPENMVHINELLDILQEKLENLQCIYCEKIFKDQRMLKEHIRKKKHLKINSKNRFYDRFYLVNYLEADKTWQDLREEIDQIDEVASQSTTGDEHEDQNEDADWGDWTSEENEESDCLFCSTKFNNINAAFEHMKTTHHFDILNMKSEWKLDFYACIKLINYARKQMSDKCCVYCQEHFDTIELLRQHLDQEQHYKVKQDGSFWKDPQYLIPSDETDGLLVNFPMFDDDE
jgi:hypothetical protein